MSWKTALVLLCTSFFLALYGCTYQTWFEGFKERQRQECLKHVGDDAIQHCLDEVNALSYEAYKRTRSESRK